VKLYLLLAARSLRARPLRMLLSGFGITLGVAAILAIGITNRSALNSVIRLFQDSAGKSNLAVTSAESGENGFPERGLANVERHPGVALAAPSIYLSTLLADQAASGDIAISFFGTSTAGLLLQGIDPRLDPQVRTYTLVKGRLLDETSEDEVVLVKDYADEHELRLDDSVEIVLPDGVKDLRLVGLIAKDGAGQQNNGAYGVLPLQTAQKLAGRGSRLDQIDVVVSTAFASSQALERLRLDLQASLGAGYAVVYPAAQGQQMAKMLSNYQIGLNFLSGMALFVGAFLIFNAFSMTVVERTREFGMLRTVGMSRRQVTGMILGEALLLGLVGSALGLVLGVALAGGLSRLMGVLLDQDLGTIQNLPYEMILTGFGVGVGVSLVAAGLPALQAGRVSPLEALRARSQASQGWLLRFGWVPGLVLLAVCAVILVLNPFPYDVQFRLGSLVVFGLFLGAALVIPASLVIWERVLRPFMGLFYGRSGRLGSANVRRSRQRTSLTVGALLIGVAMIVIVWAITDSFKGDLDEWLEGFIGGDIYVTSSLPMGQDVWRRLEATPGVAAATPVRYFEVKWQPHNGDQQNTLFMAIDPASYSRVSSFIFSAAEPDAPGALSRLAAGEVVFVSSVIAERFGVKPGDTISLLTKTGPRPFQVAAVVVDYYNQGMVFKGSWLDMNRYFRQENANAILLKVSPAYSPEDVAARIDTLYSERDRLVITTNQALMQRVSTLEEQAFSLFDVLALICMVVGFFGITNTLTMNVMERTRELGMLRGVGMTRRQVVGMILAEAAQMGLVGGVMGLILGAVLARIFMLAMTTMSGYRLAFVFPLEKALLALGIALLTSQAAALLPALRATRIRILEAIRYE
jgi:putative ABC transport system permease protein